MANISQKQNTYLFVDGSNFRQYFNETTQKWFGQEVEFDFEKIKNFFLAEKAFYYDCIDDIKTDNETQKGFDTRVDLQEKYLNRIREVEGCHVYLGSLSGRGKKKRTGNYFNDEVKVFIRQGIEDFWLYSSTINRGNTALVISNNDYSNIRVTSNNLLNHKSFQQLELYFALIFGEINWNQQKL